MTLKKKAARDRKRASPKPKTAPPALPENAVDQIIAAVVEADASLGKALAWPSPNVWEETKRVRAARSQLMFAVNAAITLKSVMPFWLDRGQANTRAEKLGQVAADVRTLCSEIGTDEFANSMPPQFNGLRQLIKDLQRFQTACEQRSKEGAIGLFDLEDDPDAPTPQGEFMRALGEAYEEAFGKAPSISHSADRDPGGPFVAFVQAVTSLAGHPLKPWAIKKAWSRR